MKELFDEHRARLTKAEDARLWKNVRAGTLGARRSWSLFGIPTALVGAAAAVAVTVVVVSRDGGPGDALRDFEARKARGALSEAPIVYQKPPGTEAMAGDEAEPARGGADANLENRRNEVAQDERKAESSSALGEREGGVSARSDDATSDDVIGQAERAQRERAKEAAETAAEPHVARELAEVQVSAAKQELVPSASAPAETVTEAIEDAIELKAGVIARSGELYIRGGRAGDVSIMVDGVQVRDRGEERSEPGADAFAPPAPMPFEAQPRLADRDEQEGFQSSKRAQVVGEDAPREEIGRLSSTHRPRAIDAMFFRHYGVNPFVPTAEDALATFAVDVDNASYSLARSYLNRGVLPPPAAIRVEEFVNAFDHGYAPPRGEDVADVKPELTHEGTFAIHLDASHSPLHDDTVLLRVGLKGREVAKLDRKPLNLTFVIDVSGSMKRENRLELVKRSLIDLLYVLNAEDEVAIVTYSTSAEVAAPPTSVKNRWALEQVIEGLEPLQSTNAEAGLRLGYTLAEQAYDPNEENRVVLCSDGVANVGKTGPESILEEIRRAAGRGITMTAIGVGMGNYNDVLLEQLADKGDGNYYYVDTPAEAKRVLIDGMVRTFQTIARDVKIQVEFAEDIVERYRLLGYENRDVADEDFRNNAVDAGEVGAGHEVTALFEMVLDRESRGREPVAVVRVRFEDPDTGLVTEDYDTLTLRDVRRSFERMPPSFKLDAAVAGFAEILRGSYWARDDAFADVLEIARDVAVDTRGREDVAELITLVHTAERLWDRDRAVDWGAREQEWLEGE